MTEAHDDIDETPYPADPKETSNDGDPIRLEHERAVAALTGDQFKWRG